MATSIYDINKGINTPLEFKGLKAQYIWFLAGGLLMLFLAFTIMYVIGVNLVICIPIILGGALFVVTKVYSLSNKYGEHGLMKKTAQMKLPMALVSASRRFYYNK